MDYRTKKEIKELYQAINMLSRIKNESNHPKLVEEYIHEMRLKIRSMIKRANRDSREFAACDRFVSYSEDGLTITEYRKYATDMNREEMAQWCREYWEDHQIHSMYDCTGQRFVSSIRFSRMRDNIYLVRIVWGLDV